VGPNLGPVTPKHQGKPANIRYQKTDLVMGHYARAGIGPSQLAVAVWGVTLRSRCDVASLGLNPWDVDSIETVVAGGDVLQEVVGDKATALK